MTIEELQIIISAKTEQVQSKIAAVKEKIAGLQPKKAADVDVTTNKAQGNLKRLQAEIDRTQAKIQKLAEKQNAVQSEIEARAGMYSAVPNLAGMGHEETVGTLMDRDPKIQQLTEQMSALDAQTAPLKTHLAEAQAQIAAAGNAAEPAAAKTRRLGESMQTAGNRIQGAGRSSGYFGRMVKSMLLSMALYSGVSFLMKSISEGMQNMALGNAQANSTMSQLATSALYLKNSIAAALMPALQALTPVINQVSDALANVFNTIAMLSARIFNHASTVTIAQRANVNYAATLGRVKQAADEAKRSIMGFDELNILDAQKAKEGVASPGMPSPSSMFETVKVPDWVNKIGGWTDKITGLIKDNANTINRLLWGIPLVVGAVLAFSGANIPLGIGLMAVGAIGMTKQAKEDWDYLTNKTNSSLDKTKRILAIVGAGELALGAIFAFSGANVPLGIGLMVGGISTTAAALNWNSLGSQIQKSMGAITFASAVAMLALGAVFAFSGANVPLGVGLLIGGATTMWASVSLNWNSMDVQTKQTIGKITAASGTLLLALGMILALTGAATPLGVGLIAAGAISLGSAAALNWDAIKGKIKTVVDDILAIGSTLNIVMGLILCLTGGGIPLGVGLILAGIAGTKAASVISGKSIENLVQGIVDKIVGIFNEGINLITKKYEEAGKGLGGLGFSGGGGGYGGSGGGGTRNAHGTNYHPGGPALVNDAAGSVYRELVQYPNGKFIIPAGRNVLIPNLPVGSKVFPAQQTKMLLPHYAGGIGRFDSEGIIVSPAIQGIGISDLFAGRMEQNQNSNSSNDTDRIISRMDKMEKAIENLKICLYTTDRMIAESSNRGNASIDRRYHTIAQT